METRNIIKSGPSSYVVSIPSKWIEANRLCKGDFLYLEVDANKLVYWAKDKEEKEEKRISMDVDGMTASHIEKTLKSAYLNNYHSFILTGKTLRNRMKEIRNILAKLIAVEIMEQMPEKIIAQEVLDRNKDSPKNVIRRMDMIIRTMFHDLGLNILGEDTAQAIYESEADVNRFHLLGHRLLSSMAENPQYRKDDDACRHNLLMDYKTINYLEMIADSLSECTKALESIGRKEAVQKDYLEARQVYDDLMEAYFRDDADASLKISDKTEQLLRAIDRKINKDIDISTFKFTMPLKEIVTLENEMSLVVLNKNT